MSDSFSRPKKSLGQNFLQDQNIIRKIVASLAIANNDIVIEIGPGRGALTELLLEQAASVHLIEFDRELCAYWQARSDTSPSLTVHEADVLKFDFTNLLSTAANKNARIKVIGNLPYNISSPILFRLMPYADQIDQIVVMLQKEVVERMTASPGGKDYGRLSVMLQQRFQIENLFTVLPTAFIPAPKVDSAIARLTPLAEPIGELKSNQIFAEVVKQAFSQRRKTLRNTLKKHLSSEQMASVGVDASLRAERLTVVEFCRLANLLTDES